MIATWTFISIGRRVTQVQKFACRLAMNQFCSSSAKKIKSLWFSSFSCKQPAGHGHLSIFFTYRSISAQVFSAKLRPPPNMVRACNCNRRERVRNMSTTATSSVGPVLYSSRTLSHPTPHPLLTIREHVQHVNNGNKFRGPCVILDHKRACATC